MTSPDSSAVLEEGDTIDGRYELVRELGAGGFARVFLANQLQLQRQVAVKVLNASLELSEKSFEARFLQEAKIVAQLNHPNIITIHDFGFAGELGQPYIAMELLHGHDLAHEIRRAPLVPSRIIGLLEGVLEALATGHDLGIVHKDLKPANLFLKDAGSENESLVVLDYGIARWNVADAPELTAVGDFTGTPHYVAPEYAKDQRVTPAIDVYQIALVLMEALTQERAADAGNPVGSVMRHVAGKLDIVEVVRTSTLWPLLSRALSVDPEERPKDAAALGAELSKLQLDRLDAHFAGVGPTLLDRTAEPEESSFDTADALAPTLATEPETTPFTRAEDVPVEPAPASPGALIAVGALLVALAVFFLSTTGNDSSPPERQEPKIETTTAGEEPPPPKEVPKPEPKEPKRKPKKQKEFSF